MSMTYYPNNKRVKPFNVNASGVEVLGVLHARFGASLCAESYDGVQFTPHYVWGETGCKIDAMILDAVPKSEMVAFINSKLMKRLCGCGGAEFLEWVSSWIKFLDKCGGYTANSEDDDDDDDDDDDEDRGVDYMDFVIGVRYR